MLSARLSYLACWLLLAPASGILTAADPPSDVVFRSDVSLVRVDAQVVDRDNRTITGLRADDFVLLEEGRPTPIRNFGSENMPVDVLLLLDVSASMRPHVQRIADAAHQALRVLGPGDRIAIMVFDRATRLRLPFRSGREDVEREFERLLRQEGFNGGTDITRGMLDAASYVAREGRRDARRAIVILTDDQTERERDDAGVERALANADAVMSALIAPDAMGNRGYGTGRVPQSGGGTWPGSGGPLGGIILGRRGPYGGRGPGRVPGTVYGGARPHSAGTAEIARESGGDSMPVDDAYALENTLARLRQRYALNFYVPNGVRGGQERTVEVQLADNARRRYPGAELRYRRTYLAPYGAGGGTSAAPEPTVITRAPLDTSQPAVTPRRPAVDGPVGGAGPSITSSTTDSAAAPPAAAQTPAEGGWRRIKPGEQP